MLERQIADFLNQESYLYVSPWPKGKDAAVAITIDSDGVNSGEATAALEVITEQSELITYFYCATHLERDVVWPIGVEIACDGDTHDFFKGEHVSRRRI